MRRILLVLILFLTTFQLKAQLGAPDVEAVYGGRISWMQATALDSQTTRIFIATESANSLFYSDIDHTADFPAYSTFATVADVDSNDGFGRNVNDFAVDATSGTVFFRHNNALHSTQAGAGTRVEIEPVGVYAVQVFDGYLLYVRQNPGGLELVYGSIDASGNFSEDTDSPIQLSVGPPPPAPGYELHINPLTEEVYLFIPGTAPDIYRSSDSVGNIGSSTTFSVLNVSGLGSDYEYRVSGIAPDGRLFVGTVGGVEPNHGKFIGYSDDNGASWDTLQTGIGGTSGANIGFSGDSSSYHVFFGVAVNNNKGGSGTWMPMASGSFETHPNDGPVISDPNHGEVIYMTTDMGLGTSVNRGTDIFEINDGIEAVQVNDFDMNAEKTIAWSASKSGIRRVTDYAGSAESWSVFFPNGDGSPYYSIAMDHSDSTGQTAYAGNVRLYKTTDGGSSWTRVFDTQDPTHGFGFWSYVSAIAVHPDAQDVVIIGVNSARISGVTGGVFFTEDGGSTWNRIDTGVYNTEVRDLLITFDEGGTTTVYLGCEYVSDGTTSSYGVKRIIHHDSTGAPYFENDMIGETGTNITNFGAHGLAVNSNGDVYAAGRKGSDLEPRIYMKEADSTFWTLLPSGTLPSSGEASAVTIGIDENGNEVPFTAIANEIHYLKSNATWTDGYVYPVGTEINMLFWDDLLVGTGTGLYGHYLQNPVGVESSSDNLVPTGYALEQNFPNPFNPATTIRYSIPERSRVTLEIFTITGQRITTLVNGIQNAATHTVKWTPNRLASGVYIYRFTASSVDGSISAFSGSGRMIFLK